jgi:glutathione S-transferase
VLLKPIPLEITADRQRPIIGVKGEETDWRTSINDRQALHHDASGGDTAMKLYSGPLSLFSRKVEIALHEKGLTFDRVMVPFDQRVGYSPKHPDVLAANPKAQVPVLIDGDLALYDSTVILEYLEDAYPVPPLYPPAPADRARCRLFELFADEIMLVPLRALMHRTEPRTQEQDIWIARELKAQEAVPVFRRQFNELDQKLDEREYFVDAFGVADIAIFMAILYSQRLAGPALSDYARLSSWYLRLSTRPTFASVISEIIAADRELSVPIEGAHELR